MVQKTLDPVISSKELLDRLIVEIEETMRSTDQIPSSDLVGWSFTGRQVWTVKLREYEETRTERAMAVIEALQMFCFSPSATFVSFFFTQPTEVENELIACLIVADADKMSGYFGTITKEDGKFIALNAKDPNTTVSVRNFDNELFGAFTGIMQYSADPIEDIQAIINVLENYGHKVTIH